MPISKLASPVTPNDLINKTNEIIDSVGLDGIGAIVSNDLSSDVSIPTSTYTSILSVSLTPGTWIIIARCHFTTNTNGVRRLYLSPTSSGEGWDVSYPSGDAQLKYEVTRVVKIQSNTTYYLRAWQNSGSALTCQSGRASIEAVRII